MSSVPAAARPTSQSAWATLPHCCCSGYGTFLTARHHHSRPSYRHEVQAGMLSLEHEPTPGGGEQEELMPSQMSLHLVFGDPSWSRRRLVSALAALPAASTVCFVLTAARGEHP